MRRRLLLAVTALPLAIGVAAVVIPGCGSDEAPIDDLCNWIKDPDNCYRALHDETRTRCGAAWPQPDVADVKNTEPRGTFLLRDALDVCVLANGGQVKFDQLPPLEAFPVTALSFTRLDARSEPCAQVVYTNDHNISLTLFPCTDNAEDVIPVCSDNLSGEGSSSGVGRDPVAVVGGAITLASEEGRDIFNATCPPDSEGEVKTYRFNQNETSKCEGYTAFLPHAEIDSDPGRTVPPWIPNEELLEYVGWVRFRLFYPPQGEGDIEGRDPDIIQYFNCNIPPQNPCENGIKDYFETDADCGGPLGGQPAVDGPPGTMIVRACERCEVGQICECNDDCKESVCVLDGLTGFNKCVGPDDPGAINNIACVPAGN